MSRFRDEIIDAFPEEELFVGRADPAQGTIAEPRRGVTQAIPPRPSRVERHNTPERAARKLGWKTKLFGVLALAATATVTADKLNIIDIPIPDLNPSPGQELGRFTISDAVVSKFEASSSNAVGSTEITVSSMTQQWVDAYEPGEKPNPHETMVLRGGKYRAFWGVQGNWQAEKTDQGAVITLPDVQSISIDSLKDPVIDRDKSSRGAMQKLGGIFGADTDDATPRANARKALRAWSRDATQSGQYQTLLACTAIAGAADNATSLLDVMGVPARVDRYYPPRAEKSAVPENAPVVVFQIPDPGSSSKMLRMENCLEQLDGIGYSNTTGASEAKSIIGMGSVTIPSLKLEPKVR